MLELCQFPPSQFIPETYTNVSVNTITCDVVAFMGPFGVISS
jgi:hypothetical protein